MDWFKTVSWYYKDGFYTNEQVKLFVEKGKITPEEYKRITGEDYTAI